MTQPNTMNRIIKSTQHARKKHPLFAVNLHHAMCLAQEEIGEAAKAINDMRAWEEVEAEIYDTIAVLVRIAEKDYLKSEPTEAPIFPPELPSWRTAYPDKPHPQLKNPYDELQRVQTNANQFEDEDFLKTGGTK